MRFVLGRRAKREEGRAVESSRRRMWTPSLCCGLGLAMVLGVVSEPAGRSQMGPPPSIINRPAPMPTDPAAAGDYDPIMMERRLNALNIERQKEMVSDTNKLLKLARELNEEVAADSSATLTEDQLHMIAQIEKLARSVKQKMADGTGQPASILMPPVAMPTR